MADVVTISHQYNNSLGNCLLLKHEDAFTGELYNKMLYSASDYSPREAVERFLQDVVGEDEIDVEDILVLDVQDVELDFFVKTYKALFGVEYRDMHTALHHLLVFDELADAEVTDDILAKTEGDAIDYADVEALFDKADFDIEIDYHDVLDIDNGVGGLARYYSDGEQRILVVNNGGVHDLYF